MLIEKSLQIQEKDLIPDTWYCCMHVITNFKNETVHQDGAFFQYLGNDTVILDPDCIAKPDHFDVIPFADFYIPA